MDKQYVTWFLLLLPALLLSLACNLGVAGKWVMGVRSSDLSRSSLAVDD